MSGHWVEEACLHCPHSFKEYLGFGLGSPRMTDAYSSSSSSSSNTSSSSWGCGSK